MTDRKKITVIDDDEAHLISTRGILEDSGYEVTVFTGGLGATNFIRAVEPDLVLLDVNMPGLSGDRLAMIVRGNDRTKHVPIVLYSSNDEDDLRSRAQELGLHGYIAKGNPITLRRRVAAFLEVTAWNRRLNSRTEIVT